MYGYRQTNESTLMTNLNSISSSFSSIDTVGRRASNTKASADNLIAPRSHSIASTSLLWKANNAKASQRCSASANVRNGNRYQGSKIYNSSAGGARGCCRSIRNYCINSETALNFTLVPLLLLTITRQVFDFLGQIWLQILINFFTTILIIVALFGIRQHRISYLSLFSLWALFNTTWNLTVIFIHTKIRDVGLNEDVLSFYTGTTSWWHSSGPGCLPYNISSIQPSISILKPISGCRIDYHLIESAQAALHALLSLTSALICCFVMSNIRRNPTYSMKSQQNSDKLYRLNNLIHDRSKVNQDPYPGNTSSRFGSHSASLRRAANKTSSRSSQHSVSSMRSSRRRNRQSVDGAVPTPRGSTSSIQRSQKYGSLSSRRTNNKKSDRRSDISSLTYGTTGTEKVAGASQRTRLSSLSSVDYLPSYQPPHSSSANLLSSYGEISSIDSYNNHAGYRSSRNRQGSIKSVNKGNTNPTYNGSRSSICSHNPNANNYDDVSYIYGNNNARNSESLYGGASTSAATDSSIRHRQQIYQQNGTNSIGARNGFRPRNQLQHTGMPQKIHAETYQNDNYQNSDTMTKAKVGMKNGSFHSFIAANRQIGMQTRLNDENRNTLDVNNNQLNSHETYESFDHQSRPTADGSTNIATRNSRHPIYSNHANNGNSEPPF